MARMRSTSPFPSKYRSRPSEVALDRKIRFPSSGRWINSRLIDRNAAIGPSIRLSGYLVCTSSDVPPVLKGLSLRYLPLTTQQKYR